jgi:hypothetical protein
MGKAIIKSLKKNPLIQTKSTEQTTKKNKNRKNNKQTEIKLKGKKM